tara:strand:- start:2623 stop:3354 length:732 start_codon:yes stop_codon:yes gene_type:complete
MALDLSNFQGKAIEATQHFWQTRDDAKQKQKAAGRADQGNRSSVTGGKNMDGFCSLLVDIVHDNGLKNAAVHTQSAVVTLPGYFRPTKKWDIVLINEGRLVAALELKSQVGSFSNNFNNRAEEAIGTAHDFWTAYREGAFGKIPRPFLGWLTLVEDAPESNAPVRDIEPHFKVFSEFRGTSYLQRYDLLCQRLVTESLYDSACLITSPQGALQTGAFRSLSALTDLKSFVVGLAGHVAAEAAR